MTSSGNTGQPRFVTRTSVNPDRKPSVMDVMTQVGMSSGDGVSAIMIAEAVSCSLDGAFAVLVELQSGGRVIAKDDGGTGVFTHHTRFTLPCRETPATKVRLRPADPTP